MIILILIYLLSIIGMRHSYRLCSSKHYDLWNDEDCQVAILWFIPFGNTFACIILYLFIMGNFKMNKTKTKSKWLNTDL